MEEEEDGDLKLHRASAWAIKEIKEGLKCFIAENSPQSQTTPASSCRTEQIINQLNIFQEDPQLLDPHLKDLLPPLIALFVKTAKTQIVNDALIHMAEIVYVFCKVRGQKVITRFLDNEPKILQPILHILIQDLRVRKILIADNVDGSTVYEPTSIPEETQMEKPNQVSLTWELRFVLMLWLSYLMQTPFDLSTISGMSTTTMTLGAELSEQLPGIAFEVVRIAMKNLGSSSKEQLPAATTLEKLALRPDMRKFNLLQSLVKWSVTTISEQNEASASANIANGSLLFLNGLISTADGDDIIVFLPNIYSTINEVFNSDTNNWQVLRGSAISKKLAIKIHRNTVIHLLRAVNSTKEQTLQIGQEMLDNNAVLENVIDFLLQALKDRETLVRYAASKALSVITSKMDAEMAEEVVEAVLESFTEDVLFDGRSKDMTAVNASRWHGLTLTLSHMLFRRSPSPGQLPRVLDALYNTLKFEQRSTTGNSLGANVRDAANFGLWSLARRYTTTELLAVRLPAGINKVHNVSKIQLSACHLVVAACLDSAGNVRRGSSAALQELIGRHPDTILHGIPLVQTVDYHAVGLRGRAMIDVAIAASHLGEIYRLALLEALFGWRGVQAPDELSRNFAALSIGRLSNLDPSEKLSVYISDVTQRLRLIPTKEVEWRSGLTLSLAEILNGRENYAKAFTSTPSNHHENNLEDLKESSHLWTLFEEEGPLACRHMDFASPSPRAHLLRQAVVKLMTAISACSLCVSAIKGSKDFQHEPGRAAVELFTQCLFTSDPSTLQAIPQACAKLGALLTLPRFIELVDGWVQEVKKLSNPRSFGLLAALASSWALLPPTPPDDAQTVDTKNTILDILISRASAPDVETRVIAIRNLVIIIDSLPSLTLSPPSTTEKILETIDSALNDYTINERGDVGSLVRLEALTAIEHIWRQNFGLESPRRVVCYRAVQRLALERLDKVRLAAARCVARIAGVKEASMPTLADISTYSYFLDASTALLTQPNPPSEPHETNHENLAAYLTGISSSTGLGSESLSQTSRAALHDILSYLPVFPPTPITVPTSTATSMPTTATAITTTTTTTTPPPSLHAITHALLTLLTRALRTDRILLPLLDTLSYILDTRLLHPILSPPTPTPTPTPTPAPSFPVRTLLSLLQKSHFKSTSLPKILASVNVYRGLSSVPALKPLVLEKLVNMLGTSVYGRVRVAVAETLWVVTGDEGLRGVQWGEGVKVNRGVVEGLRGRVLGGGGS